MTVGDLIYDAHFMNNNGNDQQPAFPPFEFTFGKIAGFKDEF